MSIPACLHLMNYNYLNLITMKHPISKKAQACFLLLGVLLLASCQDDDVSVPSDESAKTEESKVNYAISPESALADLNDFLNSDEPLSRGAKNIKVSSISPIKYPVSLSRSSEDSIDCENLIYVANFEENKGYAVLAADIRITDRVIAVVDSGNLKTETVNSVLSLIETERRPVIPGYPTTGPGFVTYPEYGDEVFMNPNTVSMYNEAVNDTLVGNFCFDDIGAVDESGNPVQATENTTSPELLTTSLIVTYAMDEVTDNNKPGYRHFQRVDNNNVRVEDGGGISNQIRYEYTYSDWSNKKRTSNILAAYRDWDQKDPFNMFFPMRRKYLFFGHRKRASAGCFPLAIAKILTHFRYPDIFTYNEHAVNWDALRTKTPYSAYQESAAALLRGIAIGCDSWCFYKGTFTFPNKARSYMCEIGLPEVHRHNYSFDIVTDMIDNGKPLIIYAVPGLNIFNSHCWNIDGYKIKERTVTVKEYIGQALQRTTTETDTCKMVHCDFGWGSYCNGYYVSNVFKLNDPNSEKDNPNHNKNTNYNTHVRIMSYGKPR